MAAALFGLCGIVAWIALRGQDSALTASDPREEPSLAREEAASVLEAPVLDPSGESWRPVDDPSFSAPGPGGGHGDGGLTEVPTRLSTTDVDALRADLLRLLDEGRRAEKSHIEARAALRGEHRDEAERLLEAVLEIQPDDFVAKAILAALQGIRDGRGGSKDLEIAVAELDRLLAGSTAAADLDMAVAMWCSKARWEAIQEARKRLWVAVRAVEASAIDRWIGITEITVDAHDVTTAAVLRDLMLTAGFNIRIDRRLPKDLATRSIKTLRFDGVPLRRVLDALLPEFSEPLVWRRWGHGLVLTRVDLEEERQLRYYDVSGLVDSAAGSPSPPFHTSAELLEAIRETLGPELTRPMKPGELELKKVTLMARVTQEVHDRLDRILEDLSARVPQAPETPPEQPAPR